MPKNPHFDWTMDSISELRRMWSDGSSLNDLATHLGVSRSCVAGKIRREGLTRGRKGEHRWKTTEISRLKQMITENAPRAMIAEEFGVTLGSVYSVIKREGISLRRQRVPGSKRSSPDAYRDYYRNYMREYRDSPLKGLPMIRRRYRRAPQIARVSMVYAAQEPVEGALPIEQRSGAGNAIWAHRAIECKWPIGDPTEGDFHFCGAPIEREGAPYCGFHRTMGTVRR